MLQLWWPGKHLASHESKLHSLNSGCLVCIGTTLENQRAEHSYRSFRLHSETQRPGTRSEEAVQQQHEHSVTPPLFPLLQSCDSPLNGTERKVASSTLMMLKLENSTVLCDSEGISWTGVDSMSWSSNQESRTRTSGCIHNTRIFQRSQGQRYGDKGAAMTNQPQTLYSVQKVLGRQGDTQRDPSTQRVRGLWV